VGEYEEAQKKVEGLEGMRKKEHKKHLKFKVKSVRSKGGEGPGRGKKTPPVARGHPSLSPREKSTTHTDWVQKK